MHDREARFRRWILLLGFVAAFLLLTIAAGGWYVLFRMPRRGDLAANEKPDPALAPPLQPLLAQPAALPQSPAPQQPAPKETPAASKEKPAATEPQKPSKPVAGAAGALADHALEALGGFTAAHLYQTYLNLGLLADAVEGEVYTVAEAKKLLDTVNDLVDTVDRQLTRVSADLKDEDEKTLERTKQLTALLRTQSRELRAYWQTNEKDNATRFHKAREEAWTNLKTLLNIQD
jgi:hypothetical protein